MKLCHTYWKQKQAPGYLTTIFFEYTLHLSQNDLNLSKAYVRRFTYLFFFLIKRPPFIIGLIS
jgi:hypothetical protein